METRLLTTRIPLSLASNVDKWAIRLARSHEWILTQALTAWVDKEEAREQLTLDALADVAVGRVIDHRTVHEWAVSLSAKADVSRKA